eukprot:scaffold46878_cov72-Cyclotella_meneghiniana.AAC.8
MIYDTVIIGGGVVGLSILRSALLAGYNAILFEKYPHILDGASGRNSGIICTGVDAAPGSLERALIRDSISNIRQFCREMNVPMRECGSLVCLWPWDDEDWDDLDEKKADHIADGTILSDDRHECHEKLLRVLRESHDAGDTNASYLSSKRVSELEPALSSKCIGAVHIPGEIVVDPFLLPLAYAVQSRELAKQSMDLRSHFDDVIQTRTTVCMDQAHFDSKSGLWTIMTRCTKSDDKTVTIRTRSVINAAGISCESVQTAAVEMGVPMPDFEARPRRGQYIVYSSPGNTRDTVPTRPIQPVPTDRTKGIFVYSTLYDQIVAGPTAKDQTSLTDDQIEPEAARTLANHASQILGRSMSTSSNQDPDVVGEYVGIRPGTSKRDYQIQLHHSMRFITVGGIRSTGLTASLGIARHVVQCLLPTLIPPPNFSHNMIKQTCATPLPDVVQMVEQYHERNDGTIHLDGHSYKVTHPLTKFGWDARTGLAQR